MNPIVACATCRVNFMYDLTGIAAGWSIFALLCVIVVVLGLIAFFMFRLIKRSQDALDPELIDDYLPPSTSGRATPIRSSSH